MVMGDKERGIALIKADVFYQLMGGMFNNENSIFTCMFGNRKSKVD